MGTLISALSDWSICYIHPCYKDLLKQKSSSKYMSVYYVEFFSYFIVLSK